MKKRVFSFLMMVMAMIAGSTAMYAQQMPQLTPLPEMPGLRTGKLPNGLTYYVLRNTKPEGRANFYIAQKVGSALETQEQLGLAHFLEHMAFNGTKTYPGKAMLNYLQGKGIRFGADINAYTAFDETVYNIDNVPTNDKNLVDSVLLVLRDWSCNLLLEDDEIEAERGVIQEEWRSRNDGLDRMWKAALPVIYKEYQYQQSPIGKMEVVMNFKPEVLRDYYHTWYRPDQQGIVVVGDFDAEEMEKKIIDLFSPIPMPEGVPERTYAEVSDNVEPIYFGFEDPELQYDVILTWFKSDRLPFEYRNTMEMFVQNDLLQLVLAGLINNRLDEYSHDPACKYESAYVNFGQFINAKTKDAFTVQVMPKDNSVEAYKDAMAVIARACKTGFTDSELERVDSEILSALEKQYNERDKTTTKVLGKEIIRHFIENVPAPGPEMEYQIASQVLPNIPVQAVNEVAKMLLTPENQVIVQMQPLNPEKPLPTKETMVAALNDAINAEYEAYVDEVITEPLLKNEPVAGKITKEEKGEFESTVFTLSNGVKVIVKPTDFSNDQILFKAWKEGGAMTYATSQAPNIGMLNDAYESCKIGNFDVKTLRKYLSGKQVGVTASMGLQTFAVNGSSTVKDLPTMMELIYGSMTELSGDEQQYQLAKEAKIRNQEILKNNPEFIFNKEMTETIWGNNPLTNTLTVEDIKAANYQEMLEMLQTSMSNAADYTMVFVGNIDIENFRPLLEKYIASLPSTGKKSERKVISPVSIPTGNQVNKFDLAMQVPAVNVMGAFDGSNLKYNVENVAQVQLLGSVLDNIYTLTLREEEGGTYSPHAAGTYFQVCDQWMLYYIFTTNNEMSERLIERANKEAKELIAEGASAEMFNQVREAAINQLQIAKKNNGYWLSNISEYERGFDMVTGSEEFLKNLTVEQFNEFVKKNIGTENTLLMVMNGVQAE